MGARGGAVRGVDRQVRQLVGLRWSSQGRQQENQSVRNKAPNILVEWEAAVGILGKQGIRGVSAMERWTGGPGRTAGAVGWWSLLQKWVRIFDEGSKTGEREKHQSLMNKRVVLAPSPGGCCVPTSISRVGRTLDRSVLLNCCLIPHLLFH